MNYHWKVYQAAITLSNLRYYGNNFAKSDKTNDINRLKKIGRNSYSYVPMEQKEECYLRYNMIRYLISSFYNILKVKFNQIPFDICNRIPEIAQEFEYHIYKTSTLLESYIHYYDINFLKIMLSEYRIKSIKQQDPKKIIKGSYSVVTNKKRKINNKIIGDQPSLVNKKRKITKK